MSFVIDIVREVDAPVELVWNVATDLDAYPEWNPFVVACRSSLRVGEPIVMQVRLFPSFTQSQQETIFENVPGKKLCYGLDGGRAGAVISRRCHELEANGPARTRYRSRFEMSGWLAPVVRVLLGSRLEHGFRSMTDALVQRAHDEAAAASTGVPS